jgi:iron complex transport system substrate-binding protein
MTRFAMRKIGLAAAITPALLALTLVPRGAFATTSSPASLALRPSLDAQAAPQQVVDEAGRRVTIPADVRRIVSLAPNLTETIYALHAESKLAGDTDYCDVPADAKSKPHVGVPVSPSLEAIVALKPDLVLATAINRRETVDALERLGVTVYALDPHTVEDLIAGMARLADLIGAANEGRDLAARLHARLDALHTRLEKEPVRRVLFVVWDDPLISIGPRTFIADALHYAGAESVIDSSQDWPHVSREAVVRARPEYIVFANDHGDESADSPADLRARTEWRDLGAVKQGHITHVSAEIDRPAPALIDAIEELAKQLHPGAFENPAAEESR